MLKKKKERERKEEKKKRRKEEKKMNDLIRQALSYYIATEVIFKGSINTWRGISKKFSKIFAQVMDEYRPVMILHIIIDNNNKNIFEKKINIINRNDVKKHAQILEIAIRKKNMDMIKIICNHSDSVKKIFEDYDVMRTVFHYGNLEYIEYIKSWGVNYKNDINIYLVSACNTGNMVMIKFAHQNGADIVNNKTALLNSVVLENLEVIKYLCENGANIHNDDILKNVFIKGNLDIINYMYELDKNIINEAGLKLLVKKSFLNIIIHLDENNMINQEHKNIILDEARKLEKFIIIDYLSKIEN